MGGWEEGRISAGTPPTLSAEIGAPTPEIRGPTPARAKSLKSLPQLCPSVLPRPQSLFLGCSFFWWGRSPLPLPSARSSSARGRFPCGVRTPPHLGSQVPSLGREAAGHGQGTLFHTW